MMHSLLLTTRHQGIPLTHSIALVRLDLYPGPPVPSPVISRHPILSVMIKILLLHLEPGLPVNSASPQCLMDLQLWLPGQARMTRQPRLCPRRGREDLPSDLLHPGDRRLPRPDPPWQSRARNHSGPPRLQKALQTSLLSSLR